MDELEFVMSGGVAVPRRGFTSIEATAFLHREFPQVQRWTCWRVGTATHGFALRHLVGKDFPSSGQIGSWTWTRVPTSYPTPAYWNGRAEPLHEGVGWVGAIEIRGSNGEQFLLFSCLSSRGMFSDFFFASTQDVQLLERFARDIYLHFCPEMKKAITIQVYGGQPLAVQPEEDERIFLPPGLLEDIELQVLAFFDGDDTYRRLRIRHRRGFLFVGPPGTGKTMMLRHLIRKCHQLFQPAFCMLRICRHTNEDTLDGLFAHALRHVPAMVILEDMDSLTKETLITRSSLLAQLDGVAHKDGVLIIGTTNNAQDVDPALIHRPSRFDRVWHFPLPDDELRLEYLEAFFKELSAEAIQCLAERTDGWSIAYLKELRTTAALMALGQDLPDVNEDVLLEAFDLLEAQFQAGRKNHAVEARLSSVGFCGKSRT